MRYLDVCAGISASTVAWKPLGWQAAAYSEIEAAPRAILAHHYPNTPLHGDFTTIRGDEYGPIDLLVGGTPCQDFSIAGLRAGLGGDRGNLSLQFLLLAARTRARWVVWENVPGVFSSLSHDAPDQSPPEIDLDGDNGPGDGEEVVVADEYEADESHALGCFLAGLSELGYGVAYRVLDAQFAGVPQRRRRIFAVGYLGDWRRAAAVLLERHSMSGNPAPRRQAGQVAPTIPSRSLGVGGLGTDFDCDGGLIQAFGGNNCSGPVDVACALQSHGGPHGRQDFASETFIAHANQAGALRENPNAGPDGMGVTEGCAYTLEARSEVQAVAFSIMPMNSGKDYKAREVNVAQPLMAGGPVGGNQGGDFIVQPVAFDTTQITSAANYSSPKPGDPCHPLAAGAHPPAIAFNSREDLCHSENVFGALGSSSPQSAAVAYGFDTYNQTVTGEQTQTLCSRGDSPGGNAHLIPAVAFDMRGREGGAQFEGPHDTANIRAANGGSSRSYVAASAVRRLTPRECERLQGFPDDYTLVPYRKGMMADGPRYKALGNSMAVPVMRWIGERISAVESIEISEQAA